MGVSEEIDGLRAKGLRHLKRVIQMNGAEAGARARDAIEICGARLAQ